MYTSYKNEGFIERKISIASLLEWLNIIKFLGMILPFTAFAQQKLWAFIVIDQSWDIKNIYNCCRVCSFSTEENCVKILLFQPCLEKKQVGVLQSWTSTADQRSAAEQQRPLMRQTALYSYAELSTGKFRSVFFLCIQHVWAEHPYWRWGMNKKHHLTPPL